MGGAETSPGISIPVPRPPVPPRTEHRRIVRPVPDPPPPSGLILDRVRAWMVVVPLDLFLLLLPLAWATGHAKAVMAMAVLSVVLLHSGGRHWARLHLSVLDDLPHLLSKLFVATALVATVIALRHEQDSVIEFLNDTLLVIGLVVAGRVLTTQLIAWGRRRRLIQHRVVMIGGGPVAADLARVLGENLRYGLHVVGFVDDGGDHPAAEWVPQLGELADLDDAVLRNGTTVLLIADGGFKEGALLDAVRTPACLPCDVLVVPRMHHFHTQTGLPDHIGSIPIMRIQTPRLTGPARVVKRVFDVVVAGVALVAVSPLLGVCALAVRREGGPGVIFRQPRVGRDGIVFDCLKLRTMRPADSREAATSWSIAQDARVGPVGRFLRRTSLDELPQLWNIIRGDMTLVGPRPERPYFVSRFSQEFHRYDHRHRVQAGLTGLAQVSGLRGDTSIADRARFDNYYIENWSLWLDVKILLRTVGEVIFARGR
jgi:exopolysaccharide biosynthesis polyprenyl glycosylphosphotransferase